MVKKVLRIQVTPGKVNPASLKPLQDAGFDINKIAQEINEKTKILTKYRIQNMYVEIEYDPEKKTYEIKPEWPPIGDLLIRAVGKEDGAHQAVPKEVIGNLSIEQVAEIAYIKFDELRSYTFKAALKQVVSTCKCVGITVEGKDPKEVLKLIDAGQYDDIIRKYEEKLKQEGRL